MVKGFKGRDYYLSNAYPVSIPFTLEDGTQVQAQTVEHAYQASKTTDVERQKYILAAPTAQAAVRRGRAKDTVLRPEWDNLRYDVMRRLLRKKFADPVLKRKLMSTVGTLYNTDVSDSGDDFWGCTIVNGTQVGSNFLGLLLAEYRGVEEQEGNTDVESGEMYYQIAVVPSDDRQGFMAYFGEVDYTKPHGVGATPLEAIADLVIGEAHATGETWPETMFTP